MKTKQICVCGICGKEYEYEDVFGFLFEEPLPAEEPKCPDCLNKILDAAKHPEVDIAHMQPLNYTVLDCETFEDIIKGRAEIIEKHEFDNLCKYKYRNNDGHVRFALEYSQQYAADAFGTRIWLFDTDFTQDEANTFIRQQGK